MAEPLKFYIHGWCPDDDNELDELLTFNLLKQYFTYAEKYVIKKL